MPDDNAPQNNLPMQHLAIRSHICFGVALLGLPFPLEKPFYPHINIIQNVPIARAHLCDGTPENNLLMQHL
jgi:hypothetical protein